MMLGKFGKMDAKKKVIEELMSYLDGKDGEELKGAITPKAVVIESEMKPEMECEKAEGLMLGAKEESSEPKMSDEELQELIEAIQSKLG